MPQITEETLTAEFDMWFARLQMLSDEVLVPEHWTEYWFDGYTPKEALAENKD